MGMLNGSTQKKASALSLDQKDKMFFVHYSQIKGDGFRSLKDGESVDYELIEGEKGWQAPRCNACLYARRTASE